MRRAPFLLFCNLYDVPENALPPGFPFRHIPHALPLLSAVIQRHIPKKQAHQPPQEQGNQRIPDYTTVKEPSWHPHDARIGLGISIAHPVSRGIPPQEIKDICPQCDQGFPVGLRKAPVLCFFTHVFFLIPNISDQNPGLPSAIFPLGIFTTVILLYGMPNHDFCHSEAGREQSPFVPSVKPLCGLDGANAAKRGLSSVWPVWNTGRLCRNGRCRLWRSQNTHPA